MTAPLTVRERAIWDYAARLTLAPPAGEKADPAPLRAAGLDDRAILDLVQIVAYFNFVNRIAEGLDVELEENS